MILDLLSKHFYSNGVIDLPTLDYPNCEQNKWKNVLFIDLFFPVDNRVINYIHFTHKHTNKRSCFLVHAMDLVYISRSTFLLCHLPYFVDISSSSKIRWLHMFYAFHFIDSVFDYIGNGSIPSQIANARTRAY